MTTQPLSACCAKPAHVSNDYEGTSFYYCSSCHYACDIATPDTEDELEKEIEFIVNPQPELSEMLEGNFTKLFKQLQKDLIRKLIRTEKLKVEKAYGGCRLCYGKGFSTYRYGTIGHGEPDLGDTGVYGEPITTHMNFCSCDRGKQLKELVTAEKLKILEQVKLEKPESAGVNDFQNGVYSGYLNAIDDLNAIREKVRNNI